MKPWQQKMWCIPPDADAEFVCAMENVLAVYTRPFDATRPVVCFDEKSKQLVGETCKPIPAAGGQVERHDYEYVRNGTANRSIMTTSRPFCSHARDSSVASHKGPKVSGATVLIGT